jgi:hypothetical protein
MGGSESVVADDLSGSEVLVMSALDILGRSNDDAETIMAAEDTKVLRSILETTSCSLSSLGKGSGRFLS